MADSKHQKSERAVIIALSVFFLLTFLFVGSHSVSAQTKKKRKTSVTKKKPMAETFDRCLPKEIKLEDIVSFSLDSKPNVTVKDELSRLKAKCVNGKLVDEKGKEIKFFRPSCWGNPPADYAEILERERKELAELQKKHTVIIFKCNPLIQ